VNQHTSGRGANKQNQNYRASFSQQFGARTKCLDARGRDGSRRQPYSRLCNI